MPIVQRSAVGRNRATAHCHGIVRKLARQRRRRQYDGGCAVAGRRTVKQIDGISDHARLLVALERHLVLQHGIRIVHRVPVGVDRERRKVLMRHFIFIQIALHQAGVDRYKGIALSRFPIGISGADQPEYNGFQTVTGILGLTFTYTMSADPLADATGSLSAKLWRDGIPLWYVDANGTTGTFTAADTVPHVFGILRRADDSGYLSIDGVQQPITVFGSKDLCTTSLFNFGLNLFGWEGWIGEVVIYNEALSEEAMNGVSMALRAKWGMP